MKKVTLYSLSICLIVTITIFSFKIINDEQEEREVIIARIAEKAWDDYNVLAYSDLSDDSTLYFVIANSENENGFQQAIRKDLQTHNLNDYSLEVLKESEVEKGFD